MFTVQKQSNCQKHFWSTENKFAAYGFEITWEKKINGTFCFWVNYAFKTEVYLNLIDHTKAFIAQLHSTAYHDIIFCHKSAEA